MGKNFKELRQRLTSEAQAASAAEYKRLVEEMSLTELRKARELTQVRVAEEQGPVVANPCAIMANW